MKIATNCGRFRTLIKFGADFKDLYIFFIHTHFLALLFIELKLHFNS